MGNIMAGIAIALLGVTLFFTADMFSRYPSRVMDNRLTPISG